MRRHWKTLVALVLLLVVLLWWRRTDSSRAPDQRLASRIDDLCQIAAKHVTKPRLGVKKWFAYLGAHSPDMLEQTGNMFVAIERIADDEKHDERARLAARRLHPVLQRCEKPLDDFFRAVEADPEANELFTRGMERFSRTLAILSGADPHGLLRGRLQPLSLR
ncbi:MAG TPA: hypothetical protein VFU21_05735 [Kofleriaceae bacterium]|nr:hypothetical protein [Kofleriaceae bacterium]